MNYIFLTDIIVVQFVVLTINNYSNDSIILTMSYRLARHINMCDNVSHAGYSVFTYL